MSEAITTILTDDNNHDPFMDEIHARIHREMNAVYVDTPTMGVVEIQPEEKNVKDMVRAKSAELGIHIDERKIEGLMFLQTPEALYDHVLPIDLEKYGPLQRKVITGLALAHRFLPTVREHCLAALPMTGSAMYLNTKSIAEQAVLDALKAGASEELTSTAIKQYLNYHLEKTIEQWVKLSGDNPAQRVAKLAGLVSREGLPYLVPMLVTKGFIGALPIWYILQNINDVKAVASATVLTTSIGALYRTGDKIRKRIKESRQAKIPNYIDARLFSLGQS